ncbi:NUCLEAR FACTOR KAPPA-B-BINDING PROTEIN [Salix purpurea]|uniref:NUCLEAR FACTOR KAPPA-B-BINDING PROTEIN n=1 Tax=Salix purpurea TaxID=77065 RepID=A0A9Q0P2D1_SALPP|nr:NUCLEAR FACTOR KAPPA-B-BINDING PROTEIN [Salix purpurea]KAJ6680337.1 NUCLEAR FACTOR KAPPA-B-BINDING PROTEIN [Salix purpurea]
MAADQRRKRRNGASLAGCSSLEPNRMKRKNKSKNDLNAKSLISLEWDVNRKKVVAKREQIGIGQRDLMPFVDSVPHNHNPLADVFAVPREIFDLQNLEEVLSYETWQNHLSEDERNFLTQFLPTGLDTEEVVEALLAGDNFHFGNPLLRWGAALCSGNLHPDVVLCQEQHLKADKKAFYSKLQDYHIDMITYLQKLKDTWESSKDPEKEILQKIWRRSRSNADKRISPCDIESKFHGFEENVSATSESCSLGAEEKTSSSNTQNSPVTGEFQKRICEKGSMKEKQRKLLVASDDDDARPGKGDKLNKCNIHHSDGAKYMSYLKISKKQHQLVKIMKQSGKSIRSKSLNCVLGDLDTLHVQPYEEFVKEEQKKLQEYWMQLANKDLPVAYAFWRERQFQRQEISKSLEDELKGQLKYPAEYLEKDGHETLLRDQSNQCAGQHDTNTEDKPEHNHETVLQDQHDHGSRNEESGISDYGDSGSGSHQNQSPQHLSSLSVDQDLDPIDMNMENDHVHLNSNSDEASPHLSEYSGGSMHVADASIDQGVPFSSGGDVWPAVSIPNSYYDPTANHEYASTGILPLPHQVNEEQCSQLIDLGSEWVASIFVQRSGHNQGQLQSSLSLEQRQKNHIEDYTQQNITEDIYSEGGGFLIPRQGHAPLVNLQDWNVNPVRMPAQLQSHPNDDGLLTQNWFSAEHQVRGDWNGAGGVGVSNQSIGSNADQSLFSVLSQCNQLHITSPLDQLRSGSPTNQHPIGTLDSVGSAEQFMLPRTYGMASGVTPRISNALPQAVHPLDYLSGRDSASSLMPDDIGWMTLPQNSALHDPLGKPYLRSWNQ